MQQTIRNSIRRISNPFKPTEVNGAKQLNPVETSLVDAKEYVDVGVQTEEFTPQLLSSDNHKEPLTTSKSTPELVVNQQPLILKTFLLSDESDKRKVGINLPRNYSVVVQNTSHAIINDLTYATVNVVINEGVVRLESELEVKHCSLDSLDVKAISGKPMDGSAVSGFDKPRGGMLGYSTLQYTGKKLQDFKRKISPMKASSSPVRRSLDAINENSTTNEINQNIPELTQNECVVPEKAKDSQIQQVQSSSTLKYVNNTLEGVLYTIHHNSQYSNYSADELYRHLQAIFQLTPERFTQILEVVQAKPPSTICLVVNRVAARALKVRQTNRQLNLYVVLHPASKPDDKQITKVISVEADPVWTEKLVIPLDNNGQVDELVLEIWEQSADNNNLAKWISKAKDIAISGTLQKGSSLDLVTGREDDHMIGSLKVLLKDYIGDSDWMELRKKGKKSGEFQIRYSKSANSNEQMGVLDYKKVFKDFILHELSDLNLGAYVFAGNFPEKSKEVMRLHAMHYGLTAAEVAFCQWTVSVDVHLDHQLSFALFNQQLARIKSLLEEMTEENVAEFWSSVVKLLPSTLCAIEKIRKNLGNLTEVLTLLADLIALAHPKDLNLFPAHLYNWLDPDRKSKTLAFNKLLEKAVQLGAQHWFDETIDNDSTDDTNEERVFLDFILVVQLIQSDLQTASKYYDCTFQKKLGFHYSHTLFLTYDGLLRDLLETTVRKACKNLPSVNYDSLESSDVKESDIKTNLYDLFLNLTEFVRLGEQIAPEHKLNFQLKNFRKWFSEAVNNWIHMSVCKVKIHIIRALEKDQLIPISEYAKHSASAVDTLEIILQMKTLWRDLNWPDAQEAFSFAVRITKDICSCTDLYSKQIADKIRVLTPAKDTLVTLEWCTALNNVYFISERLSTLVNDFGFDQTIIQISDRTGSLHADRCANTLKTTTDNAMDAQKTLIKNIVVQMTEELASEIRLRLLKLANHQQSSSEEVDSLMTFLEAALQMLHSKLTDWNFRLVFDELWKKIAIKVDGIVSQGLAERKPASFFSNMLEAVNAMIESFTGQNDDPERFSKVLYDSLNLLQKHGASSSQLISSYYKQRMMEQIGSQEAPFGILTVTCQFKDDDLIIDILNARQLISTSNAYVKVSLLPESLFPDQKKLRTKSQKKTSCPMFDEIYTIPLTKEQKSSKLPIIAFTVNNEDLFNYNSHIGDGFLSFEQVENWQNDICKVTQRQIKLNVPKNLTEYESLNILEARQTVDKEAKDFLKKIKVKSIQ